MTKTKKIMFSSLLVAIAGILAIGVAELILRRIGFRYALYPTEIQVGWPDPMAIAQSLESDREVLWVPEWYRGRIAEWQGKEPTIVFMGCSCTESGRYGEFLEERITAMHQNAGITTVNVGVGCWTTYQGLQQLKRDVVPMRPRIVTVYYGWNDHWESFGIEDKEIGKFNLKHSVAALERYDRWRVLQLLGKIYFNFKMKLKNGPMPKRVSINDFEKNLREIVRICREHDIVPVLMTAPSSHKHGAEPERLKLRWISDLNELVPLHAAYVQIVRDVAGETGAHLIDLYALFRALPEEEQANSFTKDGIHLTEMGDRHIADFMYKYFEKDGLIK
ncbi:MAG: hypothetical protein JXN60_04775 [Lentisphaerae bacterium]|nr:hypothetical protein [Lentisphaerota bacterium]